MKRFALGFCAVMAASAAAAPPPTPAPGEPTIRVRILYTLTEVNMKAKDAWVAGTGSIAADGKDRREIAAGSELKLAVAGTDVALVAKDGTELLRAPKLMLDGQGTTATLGISKVPYGIGWWWEATEDRRYGGHLEARVNKAGKIDVVNELPLEEYVCGVVPSEIGGDSPLEALKAQAVAARSETIIALREHKYSGDGYDICADVECQAFSGVTQRTAKSDQSVYETRSMALFHDLKPFGAYYASSCGGFSENVENVWPARSGPVPYWSAHCDSDTTDSCPLTLASEDALREFIKAPPPDLACNPVGKKGMPAWAQKNFRWRVEKTAEELTASVAKHKDIGRIVGIESAGRGPSGRLLKAVFIGEKGTYEAGPELAIRQVFEPPLKSAAFIVETEGPSDRPDKFIFLGAGWGHGVGMCQTGAIARALAGQDYRKILAHYYRESEVMPAYPID